MYQFVPIIMFFMAISTRGVQSSPFPQIDPSVSTSWRSIAEAAETSVATSSICRPLEHHSRLLLIGECILAVILVILMGALAGLTLAVKSVDLIRLMVWANTGGQKQRYVL